MEGKFLHPFQALTFESHLLMIAFLLKCPLLLSPMKDSKVRVDVRTSKPMRKLYEFVRIYLSQTEDTPRSIISTNDKIPQRVIVWQFFLCIWDQGRVCREGYMKSIGGR